MINTVIFFFLFVSLVQGATYYGLIKKTVSVVSTLDESERPLLTFPQGTDLTAPLWVYKRTNESFSLLLESVLGDCVSGLIVELLCGVGVEGSFYTSELRTGLLYEGWHGPPSYAQSLVASQGGVPLSVEEILMSGSPGSPNLTLYDVYDRYPGVAQETFGFYYQETPRLGFYCIYRKREWEAQGLIPDCVNISGTLEAQSEMILSATVDFITVDGTNLCTPSTQEDLIQRRPMEVVLEEFFALRGRGITTPRVAAWQRLVAGCTTYPSILSLYNSANYSSAELFLKAPNGKRVFFVPSDPDPALLALVESNGGRNDIVVQVMWALMPEASYAAGEWAFMSPCIDPATHGYTTSVMGMGRGATGCGQRFTYNSSLGSALAISPSFQLSYGSVPFSAAGKFEGLTLKRQFGTLFDKAAGFWSRGQSQGALPDNLYLSSWNEWTAQPQSNPFHSNFSHSMGLGGDPSGASLWVDSYGHSLSRDLEPAARQGGDALFLLLQSCMRVVRLMGGLGEHYSGVAVELKDLAAYFGPKRDTLTSCSIAGEACCAYNETSSGYALVRSLLRKDGGDSLVSLDPNEIQVLLASGQWEEVCNGYGGGTDFCVSETVLASQRLAGQGPFLLHTGGCGDAVRGSGADPAVSMDGRSPVYRCLQDSTALHFLSSSANCSGLGHMESFVGCADSDRTSNMPRSLFACTGKGGVGAAYHALDTPCSPSTLGEEVRQLGELLGFAH